MADPNGQVCIPAEQALLHKRSETLAMVVGLPLLVWIATRQRALTNPERLAVGVLAFGTLLVDGSLVTKWD